MKIYAEVTMMVAIETQETDERAIKDYEYIDVLELRKAAGQE